MLMDTPNPTRLQTAAKRVLLGFCTMLAIGLFGAVTAKVADGQPSVRFVQDAAAPAKAAGSVNVEGAQLAAEKIESLEIIETPVMGRALELLHDLPASALPERDEVTPRTAPQAEAGKKIKTIQMEVTAYCPCVKCCGPKAHGVTASGKTIQYNGGRFVAADLSVLPFGTKMVIPGYHNDKPVEVIDKGGAIKGNRLDVFFATHQQALEWGRRTVTVQVIE